MTIPTVEEMNDAFEYAVEHWSGDEYLAKIHSGLCNDIANYGMKMQRDGFFNGYMAAVKAINGGEIDTINSLIVKYCAELNGAAACLRSVMCIVNAEPEAIDTPSPEELHETLYGVAQLVERVANDIALM